MTNQTITIGNASAKLSDLDGLSKSAQVQCKYLSHLYVEPKHRKLQQATKFMNQLCLEADQAKITLIINPVPYDEYNNISVDNLVTFYSKFGFTNLQDEPLLLVRWLKIIVENKQEKSLIIKI